MLSPHHLIPFVVLAPLAAAGVISRQNTINPEVVYLVNCNNPGTNNWYSEMAYYSDWANSRQGQLPQDEALVDIQTYIEWETGTQQNPITGQFPDGDTFSAWDLIGGVAPGTQTGEGANKFTSFACYREAGELLFTLPNHYNCYAVYSCSHQPHNTVLKTQTTLSSNIVSLINANDPATAILHFSNDINGGGCDGNAYDIGGGGFLRFTTCRFPDDQTRDAIGRVLLNVVAPKIPFERTTVVPPQCPVFECEKAGPGPGCYCETTPIPETITSWPSKADITIYVAPEDNPTATAIHAELSFQVTYGQSPPCDSQLCTDIAAGISVLGTLGPEALPLAIFGLLLTPACALCDG
jgi:hypothetical protein